MPSTTSDSILSTPRGRLCRRLTMALAAVAAISIVASPAQAKKNHRYTSVIQTAPLSTGAGYPAPGGTAVVAGTWKTGLYGSGAVVDRVRITGNPTPVTFTFRGAEVCFAPLGTLKDTFTGTATVQPDGSQKVVTNGRFTGGTGAYRGATGIFKYTGSTAPGSSVLNGRSAGTVSY
jgi:hypothetical protein